MEKKRRSGKVQFIGNSRSIYVTCFASVSVNDAEPLRAQLEARYD